MSGNARGVEPRIQRVSGKPYPLIRAVGEGLVLPDRDRVLQVVDEVPCGVERLTAMTCGRSDDDGEVADLEVTDPVYGSDRRHRVPFDDRLDDLAQPVERRGVSGVLEGRDRPSVVVVADGADEERHSPGGGVLHRLEHL